MNISRSEARIKCAVFSWLLAAVTGLTALAFLEWLGLWALVSFAAGVGTTVVMGFVLTAGFCKTDAELAAEAAAMREANAARAAFLEANAAREVPASPKPGGPKPAPILANTAAKVRGAAAPTVARSAAAKPKDAPKPKPVAKAAPKPEPKAAPKAEPTPEPAAAAAAIGKRPAALSAPRAAGADDLKKIRGVGPKLEQLCNELGFYHFDQIAAWTEEEVAWVDENLEGFKGRVSRDDWVEQARVLAAGGETEFSKRVDEGGVY